MSADIQCPYCGMDQEINHDDGYGYEEDELHQQECRDCEKIFTFNTHISFNYDAHKAECLNYGEHEYQLTKTFPTEFAQLRCTTCGHEKPSEVTG